MAPITSNVAAHLRMDRSITQLMLENVSNTDPLKIICEDTLTGKQATYGSLRQDAFRAAYSFRHEYGLRSNDIVTIISRSCVSVFY
jgi:acyl-coenzyme A synthetase/AMP-(fatty) acid ligase